MISFIISSDNMAHIMRHFSESAELGSRFYVKSPQELLTLAATRFPEKFYESNPDSDGKKRISITFDEEIGTCNVVSMDALTDQERESVIFEDRDGFMVKAVHTDRIFPTCECQIILGDDNTVITLFPGPLAPPFPQPGETSDYWDNHVFIRRFMAVSTSV